MSMMKKTAADSKSKGKNTEYTCNHILYSCWGKHLELFLTKLAQLFTMLTILHYALELDVIQVHYVS